MIQTAVPLPANPYPFLLLKALVILAVGVFVRWLWNRRKFYVLSAKLSGPFAFPIFGNSYQLGVFHAPEKMLDRLTEMKKIYGDFWRIWLGPDFAVVVSEPEDFQCILMSRTTSYKGSKYDILSDTLGKGLLTLSGDKWKLHRNIINPSFSVKSIKSYQENHNKHSKHLVKNLEELCDRGFVNLTPVSQRYATDNICEGLFDWQPAFYEGNKDHLLHFVPLAAKLTHERMCKLWLMSGKTYEYFKSGRVFIEGSSRYRSFFDDSLKGRALKILNSRNASSKNVVIDTKKIAEEPSVYFDDADTQKVHVTKSVFSSMVDAAIAGYCTIDDIADEFNNIYGPGSDTTATMISSMLMMLGMYKRCQDRLWHEIKEIAEGDYDSDIKAEDLQKYTYLDYCHKETMRLFPTGAIQMRDLKSDFYMKSRDITLPEGTCIFISNYLLHHNPKYWKDPYSFIPERFVPEEVAKRPNFSFVPYSAGQRNCIGQTYGTAAIKTAIIHVLRKLEFYSDLTIEDLPKNADISLRSAVGCHVKITKRNINL